MCTLIVREELRNDPNTKYTVAETTVSTFMFFLFRRITSERFLQLTEYIVGVFSLERPELYYVPYQRNPDGTPQAARGKLVSAYHYMRKVLKKVGLLSPRAPRNGENDQKVVGEYCTSSTPGEIVR